MYIMCVCLFIAFSRRVGALQISIIIIIIKYILTFIRNGPVLLIAITSVYEDDMKSMGLIWNPPKKKEKRKEKKKKKSQCEGCQPTPHSRVMFLHLALPP